MIEEYKKILSIAKSKNQDNKKFFKKLKKGKFPGLDQLFTTSHNKFSQKINCLECANCCRGTGPLFKERDISRLSKVLGIKSNIFIKTYLQTDEEGDMIFKELPCPFIKENNYCLVYEDRPSACRDYPHTDRRNIKKYLNPTLKNCSICPIVYLTVEEVKKTIL